MSNAKDITTENLRINLLLYGMSGTGKTTAGCSFPKAYVADFDDGMLSQKGVDVEYNTFSNYQDFEFKFAELEKKCPFDTIVLDSITTMQEYLMDKILKQNNRKMPTMNEWNVLIASLKDLFMRITKISRHCVVIAHQQMRQDDITGDIFIQPLIVGKKMPEQLPLWFDEVYHCEATRDTKGKPVFQVLTTASGRYTAKSRLNCLDPLQDWSSDGIALSLYDVIMSKVK